jgi:hypothetical protein
VAYWPHKFRPHLPEKYDGTTNPSEFLQVYVTAITAAGGNTAVMATYFHVALSGPAWTWLMNLTPGSVYSWEELYARFMANFASAYQQHGVEAHLHAVRQEPGETLWKFISRFTKVRKRRKRRRTTTTRSHDPPLWWSQPRPEARATATNARGRRGVAAVHALCTRTVATALRSVARSLTSQSASASGACSLPKTAPCLAAALTRKRWTTAR